MISSFIIIVLGTITILYALYEYFRAFKTANWDVTTGEILKSQLVRTSQNRESDDMYECQVEYKYKPKSNIKYLTGNRILPFTSIGNYSDNLKMYEKLKKGVKIKVFYNPNKTYQSCLIRGKVFIYKAILILGILFLVFGITMFYFSNKEQQSNELNEIEIIE